MHQSRVVVCLSLICILSSVPSPPVALAEVIAFDSGAWVLYNADVTEYLGRPALSGSAYLPGTLLTNGVIEFDLAVDGSRGYPGVVFRTTSQASFEHIYIRPHAGRRNDGLQYAPAFNGSSDWQLYNGEGYTASLVMPAGEWVHVRIEILGSRARVFYGDGDEPDLVVDDLQHPVAAGAVGVRSARNASAYFSNFQVTETDDLDFGPPRDPLRPRGLVTEWEISQSFLATDVDADVYPAGDLLESLEWTTVAAEPSGLVNLSRHVRRSANGETDVVFARLFLEADQEEVRRFSFGYSDYATVYLNGTPVFSGNSSYLSRSPDYAGIVGLEDLLHLPLRAGRNELLLAVLENFGGWAVMGQDNSADWFADGIEEKWRLQTGNRLPESALHDPERDLLYVTQYFSGGNEAISRVSLDGEVLDREWLAGLSRPTGLALHGGRLWVVERRHLTEIDPETAEIVTRHEIPAAAFPNDVSFADDGTAYLTDTRAGRIYRFADGQINVWLEGDEVAEPNGILVLGDRVYWGNAGDGTLKAAERTTSDVTHLARFGVGANLDGLVPDGRGRLLVSDFDGRLWRVTLAGEITPLLDTTSSGAHCADLEYIPDQGLLIVPGLYDNRLTAYRFADR